MLCFPRDQEQAEPGGQSLIVKLSNAFGYQIFSCQYLLLYLFHF